MLGLTRIGIGIHHSHCYVLAANAELTMSVDGTVFIIVFGNVSEEVFDKMLLYPAKIYPFGLAQP